MDPETGVSRRAVLGGVAAAMAGGGCLASGRMPKARAADWPQRGYDAGGTNFKPKGSPPTSEPTVAWETPLSTAYRPIYLDFPHVLIGNGTVYTSGGPVLSLDDGGKQGETRCYERSLQAFARTDSYSNGVLVASDVPRGYPETEELEQSFDSVLDSIHGFRPSFESGSPCSRQTRWAAGSPEDIEMSVVDLRVRDGEIIAAVHLPDEDGYITPGVLMGIDTDDGSVDWRTSVWRDPNQMYVDSDYIYLHFGLLKVGDELGIDKHDNIQGLLIALDRETRDVVHKEIPEEGGTLEYPDDEVFHGARDGVAYLTELEHLESDPHFAPHLVAFDVVASEPKWRIDMTDHQTYRDIWLEDPDLGIDSVVIGPETVFVTFGYGKLGAFSAADGSVQWIRDREEWRTTGTPDALYATTGSALVCIDPATGETVWTHSFGGEADLTRPIVADTKLLALRDSELVALEEP